jgi:hypothetical protein
MKIFQIFKRGSGILLIRLSPIIGEIPRGVLAKSGIPKCMMLFSHIGIRFLRTDVSLKK